jgi:Zn-dependent proteases
VYIHPLTWIVLLITILVGFFKYVFIYMSIIMVHEIGHFVTAVYFGWRVDKIYIYPYGGYSKFNDDINKPLREELIILLMGPLIQIGYYFLLNALGITGIGIYHYSILIFNLLPIYPLDGGKMLNILMSYKLSYKESYIWTIIISGLIFAVCFGIIVKFFLSMSIVLMFILLFYKLLESYRERMFCFNKFILERYINNYSFRKIKVVKKVDKMSRDYKHVFDKDGYYKSEKEELRKYYAKR